MKTLKTSACFLLVTTTLIVISCKKDESSAGGKAGTEVSTSVQLSVSDDQLTDGLLAAMDAADGAEDGGVDLRPVSCVDVTINHDLREVIVDFGTGCVSPLSGRSRSGKIIITYNSESLITATERSFEFVNYKTVDTVTLNGVFEQSNISRTGSAINFDLSTSDFSFAYSDGKTHLVTTYDRHFAINLGNDLRDYKDNTTTITGNTVGVNKEGQPYSVEITTPVTLKGSCTAEQIFYPAAGSYDVKIGNYPKFTLSWGDGNCDKILKVSYLGFSADIVLR